MPAALDERVETPTHRSRRTHQRAGADERKRSVPPAHFMAFAGASAAFFAFVFTTFIAFMAGAAAFFAFVFTNFIAFMAGAAAFFIAFAMARSEVSEIALKAG